MVFGKNAHSLKNTPNQEHLLFLEGNQNSRPELGRHRLCLQTHPDLTYSGHPDPTNSTNRSPSCGKDHGRNSALWVRKSRFEVMSTDTPSLVILAKRLMSLFPSPGRRDDATPVAGSAGAPAGSGCGGSPAHGRSPRAQHTKVPCHPSDPVALFPLSFRRSRKKDLAACPPCFLIDI